MSKSDRLKNARISAGFSSGAEAARALGVSIPTYNSHESATRDFSDQYALKYARRFKVPVEWLVFGIEGGSAPQSGNGDHKLDTELLATIIVAVDEVIAEDQISDLDSLAKAEHIAEMYRQASDGKLELNSQELIKFVTKFEFAKGSSASAQDS